MITSLIEILELPNFSRMNTSTITFESRNKIFLMTLCTEIVMSQPLFQNTFTLRRAAVVISAEIMKIVVMFIK